jgi:hypothetical protein
MRANKLILFVLTLLLTINGSAAEQVLEPHAMLYYRVPLGGGQQDQMKPTFGFRVDRALVEPGKPINYRQLFQQTAVFDFGMGRAGIETLKIGGVDYLARRRALRANGDEPVAGEESAETGAAEAAEANAAGESAEAPASETAPDTEPVEASAAAEETGTAAAEAVAETEEEDKAGFFESLPDIFEDSQNFGLIIGGVLAAGFIIGVGD